MLFIRHKRNVENSAKDLNTAASQTGYNHFGMLQRIESLIHRPERMAAEIRENAQSQSMNRAMNPFGF